MSYLSREDTRDLLSNYLKLSQERMWVPVSLIKQILEYMNEDRDFRIKTATQVKRVAKLGQENEEYVREIARLNRVIERKNETIAKLKRR